jgi:DNA excision repair protein ERCC-4
VLVVNAHRVTDTSGESFAVRLLRGGGNSTAFVRAFSDRPGALCRGFSGVERVLKALLLRHLYLWPRFHLSVADCLNARPPEVLELRQPLGANLRVCQEAILEVMGGLLKEVTSSPDCARHLDLSQLTLEAGLFRSFDRILERQLDPVWLTAPRRIKQAAKELRLLRQLAADLLRYDAVTFWTYLNSQLLGERKDAVWLMAPEAQTLFSAAKRRVYTWQAIPGGAAAAATAPPSDCAPGSRLVPVLEPMPKWGLLRDVIAEIRGEQARLRDLAARHTDEETHSAAAMVDAAEAPILVVARDRGPAYQLASVIHHGSDAVMASVWQQFLAQHPAAAGNQHQRTRKPARGGGAKRGRGGGGTRRAAASRLLAGDMRPAAGRMTADEAQALIAAALGGVDGAAGGGRAKRAKKALAAEVEPNPVPADDDMPAPSPWPVTDGVAVVALDGSEGVLQALRPAFVVLYEPDQAFLRELEVYKAGRPGSVCRIYLLLHDTSLDEQRYAVAVRHEREAFETLIRARQHMVAPQEQDGRAIAAAIAAGAAAGTPAAAALPGGPSPLALGAAAGPSTRKAGGRALAGPAPPVVVVDVREFMSPLPCVLHTAGFAVAPVTLEVGDFVLTPTLCVERKSPADLAGSLNNGRLHHQAEAMCRHYAQPTLLIEFDADKQFGLQSPADLGSDVSSTSLCSKLALLLLHFPKLRVVWSRSVHATAALFAILKAHAPQPDVEEAAAVGVPTGQAADEAPTNTAATDFLRRLPGMSDRLARALVLRFGSLAQVAGASEAALAEALNDVNQAHRLHAFLHAPFPAMQ